MKVKDAFLKKGFYTIGALRTNRVTYPCGIKQKISSFALQLRKTDKATSLVTVGSRQYYVYRYGGNLNVLENTVVLISYPKEAFHNPKSLLPFFVRMFQWVPKRYWIPMWNAGRSRYIFAQARRDWNSLI